jgi:hypothetical protein
MMNDSPVPPLSKPIITHKEHNPKSKSKASHLRRTTLSDMKAPTVTSKNKKLQSLEHDGSHPQLPSGMVLYSDRGLALRPGSPLTAVVWLCNDFAKIRATLSKWQLHGY